MASAAQENINASPNLPERIGRFAPIKKLGRGAQGVVYLAKDLDLDREVAIKTLTKKQQQNANLINEAKNVSKLQHKNIVPLYEIGVHDGNSFLVYQYIKGEQLKQRLKSGQRIPKLMIVRLMVEILDGIEFAHKHDIVHRDLNPANILLNHEEVPMILDFGISQNISASTTSDVSGTVNYLAPEMLANQSIAPSVDIFSAGLILHELLTGQTVFTGDNPMAVMYKVVNEKILPPSKFNKEVDEQLDQIVMRALERDLSKRFQSAKEMGDELREYLQSLEGESENESTDGSKSGTLDFLLRRMQRKKDFPAISSHITEINQKASHRSASSANELSNVILKDYALTTKMLRLVNSSFYGQFGGEITTISRAIIILGYEQVRTAALSIILFEHLKNDKQANEMKMAAYSALMSGVIAREQAKGMNFKMEDDVETTFISSMFHMLGKLLSIYYFPEEYQEIKHLMDGQEMDEAKASQSVLGLPFAEIGKGVATEWQLPNVIVNSMDKMPEGKVETAKTKDESIRQISSFSNELCAIGQLSGEEAKEAMKQLTERYQGALNIDKDKIKELIATSKQEVKEFTKVLNIDTKDIKLFVDENRLENTQDGASDSSDPLENTNSRMQALLEDGDEEAQAKARQDTLLNGIAEITNSMLGDYDLNDVLTMVLETIYRGMGFSRVLFCLRNISKREVVAKFGYGKEIDEVIPKFRFQLGDSQDIIHEALSKGKEFVILDVNSKEYKTRVPDYLRKVTKPRSVVMYPIIVNRKVIGLIYADMDECTPDVSVEALKFFKTLRNQASLAIQQKQAR